MKRIITALSVALAFTVGCSSEEDVGEGSLTFSISAGEAGRVGFPHMEGEVNHAFVDDWRVTFDKYVIVISDIQLTEPGGPVQGSFAGPVVVDLTADNGAAQTLGTVEALPATRLDLGFEVQVATADMTGTADPADIAKMAAEGWSMLISGAATKDGRTVTFEFGLTNPARYTRCTNGLDNTRGVVVENSKTAGAQISAHAVHLFWDRIGTDAVLRFDPFAAMAGDDDHVTAEDLAAQDLNNLVDADGERLLDESGDPLFFYDDVGNLTRDETNLKAFLEEAMRLSIHLNGLGLCIYTRL